MGGFGEVLLWMPFAVGALSALVAIGGALHLLTNHVLGRGHGLTWRLQALLAMLACLVVPAAAAGYRWSAWHEVWAVRAAEIGFGAVLVGGVVYALVGSYREGLFSEAEAAKERLPGQGSLLQLYLLGLVFSLSGLAYIGHGFDLYTLQL